MDPTISLMTGLGLIALAIAWFALSLPKCKEPDMASPEALAALKASFDKLATAVAAQTVMVEELKAELVAAHAHTDDVSVLEIATGLDAITAALTPPVVVEPPAPPAPAPEAVAA